MKKFLSVLLMFILFSSAQANEHQADEKNVVIYIKEMNCQLCVYLVNKELRNIDGVVFTKGNINDHQVKIVAKKTVDNEQLIQAITKLKYTPEIVQVQ
ncbi:hypothetical protein A6B43_02670 [Vespertiliibacter pulmonis]|uniref:Mercuric ion binding protein n=1 Tax=Vespertiliibacter pulmonis TaxID=1443036 RepID=A0A3N4VNK7_9PAST|nr:heavy-metal-associated domain-containing protein [Vespertiliibacter pulmonis]QLB20513.1 hypothetical protein A6B43_02670 [Vespertiliibacter pulmonis]RPE80821.1 mercuric ion binding protein [Vespertiliibacter pulmonis]